MALLLREAIGGTIRRARTARQRTLRDVSRDARVSLGYLSEIERGRKEPSSELLAAICEALALPLPELLDDVADALRPQPAPTVPRPGVNARLAAVDPALRSAVEEAFESAVPDDAAGVTVEGAARDDTAPADPGTVSGAGEVVDLVGPDEPVGSAGDDATAEAEGAGAAADPAGELRLVELVRAAGPVTVVRSAA